MNSAVTKVLVVNGVNEIANLLNSDTTDSNSDDEDLFFIRIKKIDRSDYSMRVRIRNYVTEVVSSYSENEFKSHFRITMNTFHFLLELLTPNLSRRSERCGRHPLSPEKQLLIVLWVMATPNSLRCISDRFGVGNATVWRSTRRIVNALYSLVNIFIKWPSKEEAKETWQKIKERLGFPKVIGAIDGTHIKIAAPKENHEAYINRKVINNYWVCN
ncbi:uncharacterized protein [Prorops nasuta]|uniref:uncharacterized protein n=1 Tax=Prorops nasuta TaxID=863751 RepID=UPI0034CFE104